MKIILLVLQIFIITTLPADKNWIQIEPINKTHIEKSKTKLEVNLSQIVPINNMMQKASVIKQLIDATTSKKKKVSANAKNWIALNKGNN